MFSYYNYFTNLCKSPNLHKLLEEADLKILNLKDRIKDISKKLVVFNEKLKNNFSKESCKRLYRYLSDNTMYIVNYNFNEIFN